MTETRNGPPKRPVPLTVESVNDGLNSHGTTSATGGFWITAAELAKVEFPPLQWAVPGLLPEGTVLLSGPPKIGKSAFAVNLCVAVATGGRAFGAFDVEQGDALYLPLEDNGFRRARTRIAKHMNGAPESERLHLNVDMHRLDEDGVYDLEVMLDALPDTRVVVIDTLQRIRPTATSKRISLQYEEDYRALETLTGLAAARNVTIALIHHNREAGANNFIDKVGGSRGLTAVVDTVLVAERGSGSADVVMRATGRDLPETEHAFDIDFDTFSWRYLGDADTAQLTPDRRAVIDALNESTVGPLTPTQITNATGLNYDSVKHFVKRMVGDGLIKNYGGGTYGPIGKGSTW